MAIKLKGSKIGVIVCIFLFLSSTCIGTYNLLKIKDNWRHFTTENYLESTELKNSVANCVQKAISSYVGYGESEDGEKINNVTEEDIKIKSSYYDQKYEDGITKLGKDRDNKQLPLSSLKGHENFYDYSQLSIGTITDYYDGIDKLKDIYVKSNEEIKNDIIKERKENYKQIEESLANYKNIKYVLYDNDKIVKTNTETQEVSDNSVSDLLKESSFYFTLDGSKLGDLFQNVEGTVSDDYFINYTDIYNPIKDNKLKLTVIVPNNFYYSDVIKKDLDSFITIKNSFKFCIVFFSGSLITFLLSLFYIIKFRKKLFIFEKKDYGKKLSYRLYKKLWLEIKLLLILPIPLLMILEYEFIRDLGRGYRDYDALVAVILIAIYMLIILKFTYETLIKEIDEKGVKEVIKETSLFYKIWLFIKDSFVIKSVAGKATIFIFSTFGFIISIMLITKMANTFSRNSMLFVLMGMIYMLLYIGTTGYIAFKFTGSFNKIVLGAHKISQGDLSYQIEGSSIDVLDALARDINNMRNGLGKAIQNEVKSERMKTELITNVSHDLKTPLTSIINYVDLIKKGDFSKEEIEDYIKIIDRKSQRLKILIEDLFEASSAASGEMELNIEKLDIVALLKQSIAEFEEKIKNSKLDFRINLPKEKVYVMVDGKRTWRIFENQISNILKYSLDNTRVYINLEENEDMIKIIFKNISAYEIDFNEDEITERFKRGDQSRHTEGSGLGLAISKGLTELQSGAFNISVDGDLFKVEIEFKKP